MLRGSPHRGATDIRTHLNDLARRHPDLADQLRGFPGGGEPLYTDKPTTDGVGESSQQSNAGEGEQKEKETEGRQESKIGEEGMTYRE